MQQAAVDRRFIVIEGPLGAGRTTLAKAIALKLQAKLVLESENPFFTNFFNDMEKSAFPLQIFSLLSRLQQQKEIVQVDLFERGVVCDFLFTSEHIAAELHLSQDEFVLYDKLLRAMDVRLTVPDLVIYLQAKPHLLYERLQRSGYDYGRRVPLDYLEAQVQAYNHYFYQYKLSPLLVVNIEQVDFFKDERNLDALLRASLKAKSGVQHFLPNPEGE